MNENNLLDKIRARVNDPKRFIDIPDALPYKIFPCVSKEEIINAEVKLGFSLPELLQKLYLNIGNGGFGPGFGILPLNDKGSKNYHMNIVDWYLENNNSLKTDYPARPNQYLTICDWGDGITSEVDWKNSNNPIFRFNGDYFESGNYEEVIKKESSSIREWFEDWVNNVPLLSRGRL